MSRATKKSIIAAAIVLPLIVTAMLIRYFARLDISFPGANHVRSGIYIVLLSAWGISVGIRIIQAQARRYLLSISALMVLWMLLRTVKFTIASVSRRITVCQNGHRCCIYRLHCCFCLCSQMIFTSLCSASRAEC